MSEETKVVGESTLEQGTKEPANLPAMHEAPLELMEGITLYGRPALRVLFQGRVPGDVTCWVGDWSAELRYTRLQTVHEFPRPGRGDEVVREGIQTKGFAVHPEMRRHVPEWRRLGDTDKLRAMASALASKDLPGVYYNFTPGREVERTLQWPYTAEEVACQMHILKHWD